MTGISRLAQQTSSLDIYKPKEANGVLRVIREVEEEGRSKKGERGREKMGEGEEGEREGRGRERRGRGR